MIAIRADGNAVIGMGHMMRCLAIASALREAGSDVIFLTAAGSFVEPVCENGFRAVKLQCDGFGTQDARDMVPILEEESITTLLVDSYQVTAGYFKQLRRFVQVAYIDDLYLFDYDVDVVINYNIEAEAAQYESSAFVKRKVYTGVQYFPLRRDLWKGRKDTVSRLVHSVLLTTGSTDPYKCAKQILTSIGPQRYPDIIFRVLLGALYTAPYCEELAEAFDRCKNLEFLPWGQDMAQVYGKSDIVIAPGSTTAYEALSLNIPCITFQFVDNQNAQCIYLDRLGLASWAGRYDLDPERCKTNDKMRKLFEAILKYDVRLGQYQRFSKLLDGRGLDRIAQAIKEVDHENSSGKPRISGSL